jgi:hypothetical protein
VSLPLAPLLQYWRWMNIKKNERRHFQWRLCLNAPVGLARRH